MHAIKGGWVGQTFALATSSDSGGKKARIRRSKEERKGMVESFIKRYQMSNNGNFPSLNLTHKEVGGSFYTVREIVREIIQENRVLGPAKLSTEEQNNFAFLEQYPLGSISTEPQTHVLSSVHVTTDLHQSTSEDRVFDSDGQFYQPESQRLKEDQAVSGNLVAFGKDQESDESSITLSTAIHVENTHEQQVSSSCEQFSGSKSQHFDNEETITGTKATLQDEESGEPIPTDALPIHHEETSIGQLQSSKEEVASGSSQEILEYVESREIVQVKSLVQESVGSKKDGEEVQEVLEFGMTQMTADVVVETFPRRPVSKTIHGFDERSGESHEISNTLENKMEDEELNSPEKGTVPRNEKVLETQEALLMEKNKEMMDERGVLATPSEITNGSTTIKEIMPDHNEISDLNKASSPVGTKPVNAPNRIHRENLNTTNISGSPKQTIPVETTSDKNRQNVQHVSSSKKGSSPTLNRINLEKWEGRSRESAEPETNPLLALFKSVVNAFVKFLTE